MGVAKDIVAAISNLAYWMAKERTDASLRELRKLRELLSGPAVEEAEEIFDAMEMFIREGQFDDAWEQYEVLADIVVKYIEDPPLKRGDLTKEEIIAELEHIRDAFLKSALGKVENALYETEKAIDRVAWLIEQVDKMSKEDIKGELEFLKEAFLRNRVLAAIEVIASEINRAVDSINRQIEEIRRDPPLTTWLPEETYEGYEKAAKIVGETKSRYAREVLEGRRTPVEPPNGIRARERAERIAKPEEKKVEWQSIIEEAEKQEEADWERTIREAEKPAEADWQKILRELGEE